MSPPYLVIKTVHPDMTSSISDIPVAIPSIFDHDDSSVKSPDAAANATPRNAAAIANAPIKYPRF